MSDSSRSPSPYPSTGPESVDLFKPLYKTYRHASFRDICRDPLVLDTQTPAVYAGPYDLAVESTRSYPTIACKQLPGLRILPNAVSAQEQAHLISYTLDVLVPDVRHRSNLTPFVRLPDPLDLFDDSQSAIKLADGSPLSLEKIRNKQLRWITLGGQYDWTRKVYPSWQPNSASWPPFPPPLANLIGEKFPIMTPQAAIVNFYSPGDNLSPHQDVAERSDAGLISISVGCACIFHVGKDRSTSPLSILLRSGDVIIMSGVSRSAFHGVSKVFADTCPDFIGLVSEHHLEWSKSKRLNINVRQMVDRKQTES